MFPVDKCVLPGYSLLARYREQGAYTDCYTTQVSRDVSQQAYVEAFYSTRLFRVERFILGRAAARPSTDDDVRRLADGSADSFAAWDVEGRLPNQLLLSDYLGRTRSWLMTEPISEDSGGGTQLFFGSAVVVTGSARTGIAYRVLLGFHKLYSEALLYSAKAACRRLAQ